MKCCPLDPLHVADFKWFNIRNLFKFIYENKIIYIYYISLIRWTAHTRKATQKGAIQAGALNRISASTWGATFIRSRLIYSSVVRPQLAYRASTWHSPTAPKVKGVTAKLQLTQNKCLHTIAGAYWATLIATLETETYTPLLDLYLDSRVAAF